VNIVHPPLSDQKTRLHLRHSVEVGDSENRRTVASPSSVYIVTERRLGGFLWWEPVNQNYTEVQLSGDVEVDAVSVNLALQKAAIEFEERKREHEQLLRAARSKAALLAKAR
jgi:hypothetical protein